MAPGFSLIIDPANHAEEDPPHSQEAVSQRIVSPLTIAGIFLYLYYKIPTLMKKEFLVLCLSVAVTNAFGQDEGAISRKSRTPVSKTFLISGGPSYRFLNNSGDYSSGITVDATISRRMNRVLSLGVSLSYSAFGYDEGISDSFGDPQAEGNNVFYEEGGYQARVIYFDGGALRMLSAGLNAKLNLVPFRENKLLPYITLQALVMSANRTAITATSETYYYANIPPEPVDLWVLSATEFLDSGSPGRGHWASRSRLSGGGSFSAGAETVLSSKIGFFLQTSVTFTFPLSYINTSEFPATLQDGYFNSEFPLVEKSFTSLNVTIGISYNF